MRKVSGDGVRLRASFGCHELAGLGITRVFRWVDLAHVIRPLLVLLMGDVLQVDKPVVFEIAVDVINVVPFRTWANKVPNRYDISTASAIWARHV